MNYIVQRIIDRLPKGQKAVADLQTDFQTIKETYDDNLLSEDEKETLLMHEIEIALAHVGVLIKFFET